MKHVIILGNKKCGKTSLFNNLLNKHFSSTYMHTITIQYGVIGPDIAIYDCTSSKRFDYLNNPYIKLATGIIIIIDNHDNYKSQIDFYRNKVQQINSKDVPILIIYNIKNNTVIEKKSDIYYTSFKNDKINLKHFFQKVKNNESVTTSTYNWIFDHVYQSCVLM